MFTTGSKLFFGIGALALVAAFVYGAGSDGDLLGMLVLGTVATAALFAGGVVVAFRDADPGAQMALVGRGGDAEALGPGGTPASASPWPLLSAFGLLVLALGLVLDPRLFFAGVVILFVVLLEWMVTAYADRASGDRAFNRAVRDRLVGPVEFPILAALVAMLVVFGFSRVMLAVSHDAGAIIFIGMALVILVAAIVVATRPRLGSTAVAVMALVGGGVVLGAGVVSAAVGERHFEVHEHSEGVLSVDNQSSRLARITWDGETLSPATLNVPKGAYVSVSFVNRTDEHESLVVEVGPDTAGEMQTVHTADAPGPSEQPLTFRILRSGEFRFHLESDESIGGTVVVPGESAVPTPTTQA